MTFTTDTFVFLDELTLHNERTWFEANKARYEGHVREPALAFIRAMAKPLAKISSAFVADDKKVGGSLMRVYRDTRFAKDKTPYKTNIGIQFRHAGGALPGEPKSDVHAPGWYVHVSPGGCFVGVGMWRPEPDALAHIRRAIVKDPQRWLALVDPKKLGKAGLELGDGDKLTRVPKGFDAAHVAAEDLKRRSFILHANVTADEVTSARFVELVAKRFKGGADYMRFLCDAVGVGF